MVLWFYGTALRSRQQFVKAGLHSKEGPSKKALPVTNGQH